MASFPITLLYAGLLGLLLVILSFNMTKNWVRATGAGLHNDLDQRRAEALVASFTDYVPLTLVLIGMIEASGAPRLALHALGATLVAARLMHAFGSNRLAAADGLRFLGTQLTYLVLTIASFSCLYAYALPTLILK
jgi:uncharacterized membrane protein YecN with MAPEG domain